MSKKGCVPTDLLEEARQAQTRVSESIQRLLEKLEPNDPKIVPQVMDRAERRLPYKNGSGD